MQYVYERCCDEFHIIRTCRLAEYEADPTFHCPECGAVRKQVITAPRLLGNTKPFESFKSPVDGSIISCESALREHNKRNGVVNIHDGYSEKSVGNFINQDFNKPIDDERRKDLRKDAEIAIQKVREGHKPQVAQEDSPL